MDQRDEVRVNADEARAIAVGASSLAANADHAQVQSEDLAGEVRRLRAANLKLILDLQVERSRTFLPERFADESNEHRRAAPFLARRWSMPSFGRALEIGARLRDAISLRLPMREGVAAAPWSFGRIEAAAFVVIVLAAILLRFVDLSSAPPGVQGDESAIALEGQRVRRDGWIGPYTSIAAGSPTGAIYAVAGLQVLMGDSILTVRVVSAIFGVLTVVAMVLVTRRSYGRIAGLTAGALLATMGWHIHYSRLGFPNILWPFFVIAGLGALVEAVRDNDRRFWVAAGVLLGLGIYTYNAHVIVLGIILGYLALLTFGPTVALMGVAVAVSVLNPGVVSTVALVAAIVALVAIRSGVIRRRVGGVLTFGIVLVLIGAPMIEYAADEANNYFGYSERLSVMNTDDWAAMPDTGERISWMADRYVQYWNHMCCDPEFDGVDATGTVPLVPRTTLWMAAAGVLLSLWYGRRVLATLSAVILFVIPLTSVMSVDFALRRTMIETIFLALFAAVGITMVCSIAWKWVAARYVVIPLVGLLAVVSVRQNFDDYYYGTLASTEVRWVNAVEMVAASEYIATLPTGSYVYFMTDRWPYSLEIRRYFAPDIPGEDRTQNFGENRLPYDPEKGRPVYIMIGSYEERLADLQGMYPGGEVVRDGPASNPDFVAYFPPWPPLEVDSPAVLGGTPGPAATPSGTVGG